MSLRIKLRKHSMNAIVRFIQWYLWERTEMNALFFLCVLAFIYISLLFFFFVLFFSEITSCSTKTTWCLHKVWNTEASFFRNTRFLDHVQSVQVVTLIGIREASLTFRDPWRIRWRASKDYIAVFRKTVVTINGLLFVVEINHAWSFVLLLIAVNHKQQTKFCK